MDTTSARKARTAAEFKRWATDHKPLALSVCKAKAIAQLERERVDAYVRPIFESFRFVDPDGKLIEKPNYLYLCEDEALCQEYYAQCEVAHRARGFTGPEGHCPALSAEHLLTCAESALIEAGAAFLGIDPTIIVGDDRKKMLDLLLGACINA